MRFAFDLFQLHPIWNVTRGTDNLPANFSVSATLADRYMSVPINLSDLGKRGVRGRKFSGRTPLRSYGICHGNRGGEKNITVGLATPIFQGGGTPESPNFGSSHLRRPK